jgi:GrpB-like predicted nucleotidyltransferase (UPF0157 family)
MSDQRRPRCCGARIARRFPGSGCRTLGVVRAKRGLAEDDDFSSAESLSSNPPLGIQLTAIGGEFDSFDHFVEAPLASPQLVSAYNAMKSEWNGAVMQDYRKAKDKFVAEVLARHPK